MVEQHPDDAVAEIVASRNKVDLLETSNNTFLDSPLRIKCVQYRTLPWKSVGGAVGRANMALQTPITYDYSQKIRIAMTL